MRDGTIACMHVCRSPCASNKSRPAQFPPPGGERGDEVMFFVFSARFSRRQDTRLDKGSIYSGIVAHVSGPPPFQVLQGCTLQESFTGQLESLLL
jgi:hypothetical protein